MHPEEVPTAQLLPGQVGYVACNMKQSSEGKILNNAHLIFLTWVLTAHIGDTLHHVGDPVEPMPGFQPAKAMVWSSP
jgi:translation elongation factor EF-4